MTWDSYKPLQTTPRLEFPQQHDLVMGDSLGKINPDDTYTSYHIANISENGLSATLWNYDTETFETFSKDEIHTWLKNETPIDAILSTHSFTVTQSDFEPVGFRIHGSAMQSKETIKMFGDSKFTFCLRLAVQSDTQGFKITEPYYADEHIQHDDFDDFSEAVKTDFKTKLLGMTPLDEKQASTILSGIMSTIEHNANQRISDSNGWDFSKLFENTSSIFPSNSNQYPTVSSLKTTIDTETLERLDSNRVKYHQL